SDCEFSGYHNAATTCKKLKGLLQGICVKMLAAQALVNLASFSVATPNESARQRNSGAPGYHPPYLPL
ncbi:MAG: hypothetical protein KDA69_05335, partial [Planctomycetaceae bacterium]|nr:hypothetical protein [Planctomycetaceae bacterium]